MVDNEGRTIPVRGFRVIAVLAAALTLLACVAAISAFWLYGRALDKLSLQETQLSELRDKTIALRQGKEELMARLVLAEEISVAPEPSPLPVDDPDFHADSERPPLHEGIAEEPQAPEVSSQTTLRQQATSETPPAAIRQVQVEDFKASRDEGGRRLSVQFIIRKIESEEEAVSGYGFVILKPEPGSNEDWLVFPTVDLKSGLPEAVRRGQFFSIARFKSMRFEKRVAGSYERFEVATVLIYDTEGQLLVEKNFPVGPIEVANEIDG